MQSRSEQRSEPRFDWFIPIDGDGEHIGTVNAERPPTFEYLKSVVETAEAKGFYSLLIPTKTNPSQKPGRWSQLSPRLAAR